MDDLEYFLAKAKIANVLILYVMKGDTMEKDDTTWHVWFCPLGKRHVDKYSNREDAYREHKAATKEGLRSYLRQQYDPTNEKD